MKSNCRLWIAFELSEGSIDLLLYVRLKPPYLYVHTENMALPSKLQCPLLRGNTWTPTFKTRINSAVHLLHYSWIIARIGVLKRILL
jgi:hypothetical protein